MRLPDRVTGLFLVGLGARRRLWRLAAAAGARPAGRPQRLPAGDRHRASRCAGSRSRSGSATPSRRKKRSIPVEGGQARAPPPGKLYGLRALLPPALLLFYVAGRRPARLHHHGRADRVRRPPTALGARWKLALPLAALAPIGIHLIFSKLLRVPLPGRAAADALVIPCCKTLIEAFALISTWEVIIAMLAASVYGLVIGSLPGLSATMATALLVPVTFYLSPIAAIATIVAASSMAIFSGDIPGALLRIPGTPASAAYADEAYAMTRKGAGRTGARRRRLVLRASAASPARSR